MFSSHEGIFRMLKDCQVAENERLQESTKLVFQVGDDQSFSLAQEYFAVWQTKPDQSRFGHTGE